MIPILHRIHNKCLISTLNKKDKVVDYYQKLQQSPSMHQFKKILHVLYVPLRLGFVYFLRMLLMSLVFSTCILLINVNLK